MKEGSKTKGIEQRKAHAQGSRGWEGLGCGLDHVSR